MNMKKWTLTLFVDHLCRCQMYIAKTSQRMVGHTVVYVYNNSQPKIGVLIPVYCAKQLCLGAHVQARYTVVCVCMCMCACLSACVCVCLCRLLQLHAQGSMKFN